MRINNATFGFFLFSGMGVIIVGAADLLLEVFGKDFSFLSVVGLTSTTMSPGVNGGIVGVIAAMVVAIFVFVFGSKDNLP